MTGGALALAPSPDVSVLEGLPENEIDAAVGVAWQAFGRRTVTDAWYLGTALRRVKDGRGRTFAGYCEGIGMNRSWAYRLLKIAGAPKEEVCSHYTVDGAVKALKAAPVPTVAPANAVFEKPVKHRVEVVVEPDPEVVLEEVAAAEEREHPPAPVVVDEESEVETHRRRHREDVAAHNALRRELQAERRKNSDIRDALLASPTCPNCDAVLARFWSVARPAA